MKIIGLIGKPSRDKSFMMLYLGKLLSVSDRVIIVTENQWFMPELDHFDYSEQLLICKEMPREVEAEYALIEVVSPKETHYNVALYISGIDRWTVAANSEIFAGNQDADEQVTIFLNVLMDGKINEKYLCQRLGIDKSLHQVRTLYLNDNDMAVAIENGYDETLNIRGLSKDYKKLLREMMGIINQKSLKELKQQMRSAERSR